MEKVIYLFGRDAEGRGPTLDADERADLVDRLGAVGARGVQLNLIDPEVASATRLAMGFSGHPAGGAVSVWVDSATDHLRGPVDEVVAGAVDPGPVHAYLVTESVPLRNTRFPAAPGERTHGMAHLAFFRRPEHQPVDEWLHVWLDDHTHVALDLQDTFAYVQNVVTRRLTPDAPPWDAIVEECFPAAAMTDPHALFDTTDDAELARRERAMYESVARFIDLSTIDVVPTGRYAFEDPAIR